MSVGAGTLDMYGTGPMIVTDAMVERALDSYFNDSNWRLNAPRHAIDGGRDGMRAALTAVLAELAAPQMTDISDATRKKIECE